MGSLRFDWWELECYSALCELWELFSSQLPSNISFLGIFYTWNFSLPLHMEIIIEPKAQGPPLDFWSPFCFLSMLPLIQAASISLNLSLCPHVSETSGSA